MQDSSTVEETTDSQSPEPRRQDGVGCEDSLHVQLLQYQLMRAKLDVQGCLTTITSLQGKLRVMERTILELRAANDFSMVDHSLLDRQSVGGNMDTCTDPENTLPSPKVTVAVATDDTMATPDTDYKVRTTEASEESSKSTQMGSIFGTTPAPDAPTPLYKGTSTAFLSRAYFSPSGSSRVFVYDEEGGTWAELPECPNTYFSLVTVNGLITAVGGWVGGNKRRPTNTLLSLSSSSRRRCCQDGGTESVAESETSQCNDIRFNCTDTVNWSEHFPPMPTRRGYPAAVSHKHWLVVAGGDTTWLKDTFLSTVEILDTTTLQWSSASSLPQPLRGATAAVCVNRESRDSTLYLLGGWDKNGSTVFACSLESLLSTAVPCDPKQTLFLPQGATVPCSCCWKVVAAAPHSDSSCVSLGNKLFTFGGRGAGGGGSEHIHVYCEATDEWQCIGKMLVGRAHPLVSGLADGCRAVIAGGMTKGPHVTSRCEVALLIP